MDESQSIGFLGELTREACLGLLAVRDVGRVAVVVDGQPIIFPVNYLLDGDLVVFRTDPGTKLDHGGFGPVAFEIDYIDESRKEGWSVVVTGMGREITGALDRASEREQLLPLTPWAGGPKEHWIRIISPTITGRRLHRSGVTRQIGSGGMTSEPSPTA